MSQVPPLEFLVSVTEHIGETRSQAATIKPDDRGLTDPSDPLDWDHALEAAAARLIESSIEPDTIAHMEASGQANEFAATLCAYGLLVEEVEHMHRREDDTEAAEPAPPGQPKIAS
jgi:hypothetical protein